MSKQSPMDMIGAIFARLEANGMGAWKETTMLLEVIPVLDQLERSHDRLLNSAKPLIDEINEHGTHQCWKELSAAITEADGWK